MGAGGDAGGWGLWVPSLFGNLFFSGAAAMGLSTEKHTHAMTHNRKQ